MGRNKTLQSDLRHDAFAAPTREADFWAGFIAADGYITAGNVLGVSLKSTDEDFVLLFADWVGSKHIYRSCRQDGRKSTEIKFASSKMAHDLLHNYGIGPRKSLTLQPITRQSLPFVAGYWEGDGGISRYCYRHNMQEWVCSFAGTKKMLEWIKSHFSELSEANVLGPVRNCCRLSYKGNQLVPQVIKIIAENSVAMIPRKRELCLQLLNVGVSNAGYS